MNEGIVCKLWNIKGTSLSKSAMDHLRDSLGYILNDEKTSTSDKLDPLNQLTRECKYIENDLKTFSGAYVGGNNISSTNVHDAVSEMMDIKRFFGKEGGRAALHMCISLPESESGLSNAANLMQLCDSVIKELFPDNQAVFAIHTNTENLHAHIIINSVGLNGKKIHQNKKFVCDYLHPCINKYAAVYGFSQNPKWKTTEESRLTYPQLKITLRREIDKAIEQSESFDDFVRCLQQKNIKIRTGKYISLSLPEMQKPIRTHNLGSNYTRDAIVERILTRKEKFMRLSGGNYAMKNAPDTVSTPNTFKMPKYKDMTPEMKKETIHLLRLGRNPWRENRQMNYQLNKIADDLNLTARARAYVEYYSGNGSVEGALEGMIEKKKQAASDKKLVAYAKNKYKPILDIYNEMKKIERRTFLYDYKKHPEYRKEYEEYRRLTKRLKDGYNKDVFEVAAFLNECNERILYSQAQINEISFEYRELKRYAEKRGIVERKKENNLLDLIGFSDDKELLKYNIAKADWGFITSPYSTVLIKYTKNPTTDKYGNPGEEYHIEIVDRDGKMIEEIKCTDKDTNFRNELKSLQDKYNLAGCRKFSSSKLAYEYCASNSDADKHEDTVSKAPGKTFYFTQAVNHVCNTRPANIIVSKGNPSYMVFVSSEEKQLKIVVFNRQGKTEEVSLIPHVKSKTDDGYKNLLNIMNKYDFQGEVMEFNTIKEAKIYRDTHESAKGRSI